MRALNHGSEEAARTLLAHGADINFCEPQMPALVFAAGYARMAKLALDAGARVTGKAIELMSKSDNPEAFRQVLPHASPQDLERALLFAVTREKYKIIRLLTRECGARPTEFMMRHALGEDNPRMIELLFNERTGRNAIAFAARIGDTDAIKRIVRRHGGKVAKRVLNRALDVAVQSKQHNTTRLLCELGAKIDYRTRFGDYSPF